MDDYCYSSHLNTNQILQAQTDSQSSWGGGMTLPDGITRLERLLEQAGPSKFRLCGPIDTSEAVIIRIK